MRFIDISLPVDRRLPVWPGDPPIEVHRFLDMGRGDQVNASRISFSAYTGTHVDAPRHHFGDGAGADELHLGDLIGDRLWSRRSSACEPWTPCILMGSESVPTCDDCCSRLTTAASGANGETAAEASR